MKKSNKVFNVLIIFTIILLILITLVGIISFNTDKSYTITNQYGHEVKIFGSGIYEHDSYFRAPIFIGSDATMLILVVPLLLITLIKNIKNKTVKSKLFLSSLLAVVLYYAASIAFGVTYNSLQLIYIALFASSLFAFIISIMKVDIVELQKILKWNLPSKGVSVFLVLSGISLFIAWLPDIIPTIIAGTTLPLIEVYTTEITYVLDMGIISPLMFICLYLLKKRNGLGIVILSIIFTLCTIIGVMLPVQTVFQILAGIVVPIPVLIIKVGIFIILAMFAVYFNTLLYKRIEA